MCCISHIFAALLKLFTEGAKIRSMRTVHEEQWFDYVNNIAALTSL
jgi:hypothetical protein